MRRSLGIRLILGLLVCFVFSSVPQAIGQDKDKDKADEKKKTEKGGGDRVKFETVDQVELHGTYYDGPDGKKSSCVLLLHDIGGKSQEEGWDKLAKDLQQKGYAVLSFDFRGHGDSTAVGNAFWSYADNKRLRGYMPGKVKDKISYKDIIDKQYYLHLVDDIAAAKLYLDRRNDAGDCNSSSLIVIGAGEGAALGALWISSEFSRRRITGPAPVGVGVVIGARGIDKEPEGKTIACAVWLSIGSSIGGQTYPVRDWLKNVGNKERVPMAFIYGSKDQKSESFATAAVSAIKTGGVNLPFTAPRAIPDTNLSGQRLVSKGPDASDSLISYLGKVMKERTNDWDKREVDKNAYVWLLPPARQFIAKNEKEKNMNQLPIQQFVRP